MNPQVWVEEEVERGEGGEYMLNMSRKLRKGEEGEDLCGGGGGRVASNGEKGRCQTEEKQQEEHTGNNWDC